MGVRLFLPTSDVRNLRVAGGGVALFEAAKALQQESMKAYEKSNKQLVLSGDESKGFMIIKTVLEKPLRIIAENSGKDSNEVASKVFSMEQGSGFNALTGEYADMFKEGIIDPLKVVKATLVNAASIASLILTTEAIVAELPEEKEKGPKIPDDY